MVGSIRPLDASVVNKIAAGEIIISPVNALKEMMENSIDAGATAIDVLAKDGGIKLLQITDNGSGISRDDLPILCERFTTSKLNKFEDLQQISTYGFRGEALASISHIARVSVTTKTTGDRCAWRATYAEGKMLEEPKPVAGRDGTVIVVEDLFYNIPSRLRALRSPGDEYNKILDVVGRYAIHCQKIAFSCKRSGDSNFSLTVRSQFTIQDRIRTVFGNVFASNLVSFVVGTAGDIGLLSVTGQVSNTNLNVKKSIPPIFFINERLVACDPLRRALMQVYSNYLPKGTKPFIYLNIAIDPGAVDVNVHPTKREVRFLNQDEIIEKITFALNEELSKTNTSRTFKTPSIVVKQPSLASHSYNSKTQNGLEEEISSLKRPSQIRPSSIYAKNRPYEHNLVRTDESQTKITSFLRSSTYEPRKRALNDTEETIRCTENKRKHTLTQDGQDSIDGSTVYHSQKTEEVRKNDKVVEDEKEEEMNQTSASVEDSRPERQQEQGYVVLDKEKVQVSLTSIKNLRKQVDSTVHKDLTNIFSHLTYVGIVDEERRLAAIQHDLRLFLVDYGSICYELFYQLGLTDFSNFSIIELEGELEDDLKLSHILSNFEHLKDNNSKLVSIIQTLWSMHEMLQEYFSITLVMPEGSTELLDVRISTIPLLLKEYIPSLSKLPYFLYRLGTKVNWTEEEACLDGILKQIALFNIPEVIKKLDITDDTIPEEEKVDFISKADHVSSMLEYVIFPCIKKRFLAPKELLKDVCEIANLPGLYKVFERC